jgi:DNA-binding transcriptional ArsR family regulator
MATADSNQVVQSCESISPARAAGKPPLADRPLITLEQAEELVGLFKVLGNDSRLRLIHALERAGELRVSELAARVGMRPQAVSNQLQRLADRRILASRRDGNNIHYRIADPCVTSLLDLGICLTEETRQ